MSTLSKFFILTIFGLLFSSNLFFAQDTAENWVPVDSLESTTVFINTEGLNMFKGDDFYFWTLEKHDPPLVIESIDSKVYKTKTYYLINKKLRKYSIMEIIYFDHKGNVAADYSYKRNMDNAKVKYNYPIIDGSSMEKIFNTCLTYMNSK